MNDLRLDVLSTLTPEAVEKIRPFRDYVLIRRTPTRTMSAGGLHIPSIAQDEPMEGIVIAVGPGRPFPERFCTTCRELAVTVVRERDVEGDGFRFRYGCADHPVVGGRPILERRPVGVEKGQRVVFSKHAGGRQFKRVRGPDGKIVEYILTDDVIGACEPGCGMVERSERYA